MFFIKSRLQIKNETMMSNVKHGSFFYIWCQGPFRDPAEVLQQRYKPLQSELLLEPSCVTLQIAREKLRLEEWRNRVHDNV